MLVDERRKAKRRKAHGGKRPMVVPGENVGIAMEGTFFIFRSFDPKFGFKSMRINSLISKVKNRDKF
jgi:hypothetical protein